MPAAAAGVSTPAAPLPYAPPSVTGTFPRRLALVAALAAVLRGVVALASGFDAEGTLSDSFNYHLLGAGLADGEGYVRAFDRVISDVRVPTAEFPPLFPGLLAVLHLAGVDTVRGQEVALALLGTATVVLIGLVGRHLGGDRVGVLAAAIAAAYPMLVLPDVTLQAEGLYALFVAASLLVALRARRSSRLAPWAACGALAGLAALTRSEGVLLVPLVLAPAARAWRPLLVAAIACVLVLAPWFLRNLGTFEDPVLLSNNSGTLLAGANCPSSWHGDRVGLWTYGCVEAVPLDGRDEAERTRRFTDAGIDHVLEHPARLPAVAAVRVLRTFGAWAPGQQVREETEREGRHRGLLLAGYACWVVLAVAAVAGARVARRSGLRIGPVLGTVAVAVATAALTYGNQRFRMSAEPAVVVLAALGLSSVAVTRGAPS